MDRSLPLLSRAVNSSPSDVFLYTPLTVVSHSVHRNVGRDTQVITFSSDKKSVLVDIARGRGWRGIQ